MNTLLEELDKQRWVVTIPGFNDKLDPHYRITVAKDEKAAVRNVIAKLAQEDPKKSGMNPNARFCGIQIVPSKVRLLIWKITNDMDILKTIKIEKL